MNPLLSAVSASPFTLEIVYLLNGIVDEAIGGLQFGHSDLGAERAGDYA